MKKLTVSLLLCGSLLSLGASAADDDMSPRLRACVNDNGGGQCFVDEDKILMKQVNATYGKLMATMPPDRKKRLEASQGYWLKYKKEFCAFAENPEGGTAGMNSGFYCDVDLSNDRIKELNAYGE